jgi:hypothetical protein
MVAKADAVRYPNRDEGELGAILKSLSPAERACKCITDSRFVTFKDIELTCL